MTEELREEPDSAELDALRELAFSAGYGLVVERINEEIERQRGQLEEDLDIWQTARVRGYIAALRMVLTLPEILKSEIPYRK